MSAELAADQSEGKMPENNKQLMKSDQFYAMSHLQEIGNSSYH